MYDFVPDVQRGEAQTAKGDGFCNRNQSMFGTRTMTPNGEPTLFRRRLSIDLDAVLFRVRLAAAQMRPPRVTRDDAPSVYISL